MKQLFVIFFVLLFLGACKEKKKTEPASASTTGTTTAPVTSRKQVSVKINGTEFSCTNCVNTYHSSGSHGINFREDALNRFVFNSNVFLAPGTYSIASAGALTFLYEKDGYYYRASSGSMTVTAADTSARGTLVTLKASFSCVTDTIQNVSYNFTEGQINIDFK